MSLEISPRRRWSEMVGEHAHVITAKNVAMLGVVVV